MYVFAMLSYIQRTSVAVASGELLPALHFNTLQLGWLNAAFTTAYMLAQIPGGALGQRLGARTTYVIVGVLGVIATLATPLAPWLLAGTGLFVALLAAQCLLGVSQGPVIPVFAGVMQAWFPANRWAVANGLHAGGMLLGGAVTPLLIVLLTRHVGWQGALLWTAVPVALITVAWAWYGRNRPREHPAVTPAELAELDAPADARPLTLLRLWRIMSDRNVLWLTLSYLLMNYAFYWLTFWSFVYLVKVRHFAGLESGFVGMLPWIGAAIGATVGGFLTDRLVERFGLRWGYRLVPLAALPLVGVLLVLTHYVSDPYSAVLTLTLAFAAVEITEAAYWAATMRIATADSAAATGVLNTGGNIGGILCQPITAYFVAMGVWGTAFTIGALLAVVASALWLIIDASALMREPQAAPAARTRS
ncbi:MAG: MFS transporter [Steroidobacteraceae bacterium]